ncbi:MAG: hypothetical protein IT443_09010 [Phycisphaeraceae bacterium]|nr:hypothetical protein [Phycisphaeraceae bacterium]
MKTKSIHQLRVGVARTEITPPLQVGFLMSAVDKLWEPFKSVRLPLYAKVLLLAQGRRRVAMVTIDSLGISGKTIGGMGKFKSWVIAAAGRKIQADELVLTFTHSHSAPCTLLGTDLYRTAAYKKWMRLVAKRIGLAIKKALANLEPAELAVGIGQAPGLGIYRRFKTTKGIVLSHPRPPKREIISTKGPTDPAVHVLACRGMDGRLRALWVTATCHPVHEMCMDHVSPDYPGEMALWLQKRHPGIEVLFSNGAAGDINPTTVSGGPAKARAHGQALAKVVEKGLAKLRPISAGPLVLKRAIAKVPQRSTTTGKLLKEKLAIPLVGLRIGPAVWAMIPSEPFVEYGLRIKKNSRWPYTAVVGYTEDMIGYLPTERAFKEGGYELGPGARARVGRGTEKILTGAARKLMGRLGESREERGERRE